mmetsp:Transcript_4614/g.5167  ORF Transcript_4614/g.5167 Transcript_4614/m.5167 type:complete len:368 (-) Transcript_4614:25-1128(-)
MTRNLDQRIRPALQVFEDHVPHPSECRGNPYSQDTREMAVQNRLNGNDNNPNTIQLQEQHLYPHPDTVTKYINRQEQVGHCRAYRHTGNARSEREIQGHNLILLSLYRLALPKATHAEVNAFLYVMNSHDPLYQIYSHSQICRAEQKINLTKKRSSTTAYRYQALEPRNVQWRENYWNMNFPFGIANIDPRKVIDLGEAYGSVDGANRSRGTCFIEDRARIVGPYSEIVTLLMAVLGDPANPERWFEIWNDGGTTVTRFYAFIERILRDIGDGTPGNRYCFTMDNLNAHTNAAVTALIYDAGHRIVFRAPYYPVDSAIEYIFNVIQCALCINLREIKDTNDYIVFLRQIITNMPDFSKYFAHVGFIY